VKAIEPADYALLRSPRMDGVCGERCASGSHTFTGGEETILRRLITEGRVRLVPCGHNSGMAHAELTANGREALRIFEAMIALDRCES
jgi:hypothetical protein